MLFVLPNSNWENNFKFGKSAKFVLKADFEIPSRLVLPKAELFWSIDSNFMVMFVKDFEVIALEPILSHKLKRYRKSCSGFSMFVYGRNINFLHIWPIKGVDCWIARLICRVSQHDVSTFAELHNQELLIDFNELPTILKQER